MEEPIAELLDRTLRSMGVRAAVRDAQIGEVFAAVMGPVVSGRCRAERLERGTLVVATSNTALSHQIQLDSVNLIAAINERLGAETVHRIRFVPLDA